MAYFSHAYKKVFVGGFFVPDMRAEDLEWGLFGLYDARTWDPIAPADANVKDHPGAILAMGAYREELPGAFGGYGESIKSQIINPHLVHRFWKVLDVAPVQQVVQVGWNGTESTTSPKFKCGQNYSLRIDLRGSPVVRFLGLNFYRRFDVFTDCCADAEDPLNVDPIDVLLEFAKQINADPVLSQFVVADVITTDSDVVDPDTYEPLTDEEDIAAAIGALRLTVIYTDTSFGCSFDMSDNVDTDPVIVYSAQLVDEMGNSCPDFSQLSFTQTTAPAAAVGSGRKILQDWRLSNNYRREIFHPSVRRRQIEKTDGILEVNPMLNPTDLFWSYYILHSVDRRSNPTGVYDNDQYLIQLNVYVDTEMSDFELWMSNYLGSANTGVVLEDLS